jgi:hypothetical protein
MIPDHVCVPGLERPVTVSEYPQLEGLSEALVLTLIRELKLRKAAYFRGQWFLEAPRNSEARLAQLRGEQPTPRNDKANIPTTRRDDRANIPAWEDEEFWGPIEREAASDDTSGKARERTQSDSQPRRESRPTEPPPREPISPARPVRAPVPQPVSNTQEAPRTQPVGYTGSEFMAPEHLRVPGLTEPLTAAEYAKLEGLDEMNVIEAAFHGRLPAVYLRGWYIEAPPYSEERVSRLRGESKLEPRLANWLRQHVALHDDRQHNSERERLRVQLVKSHWRYDKLTPAQQEALLRTNKYAERPQPLDYGLSRYDVYLHTGYRSSNEDGLKFREPASSHEWRRILGVALIVWACAYGGILYLQSTGQLKASNTQLWQFAGVLAPLSLMATFYLFAMTEGL